MVVSFRRCCINIALNRRKVELLTKDEIPMLSTFLA